MEFTDVRLFSDVHPRSAVDGRWILVDGYVGGVRVPEAELTRLTLTIEEGTFTIGSTEGVVVFHDGPHCGDVDMITITEPDRGTFVPGIFERSQGVLRVCYNLSGASRPTAFDAPPGTRLFVALYRRSEELWIAE